MRGGRFYRIELGGTSAAAGVVAGRNVHICRAWVSWVRGVGARRAANLGMLSFLNDTPNAFNDIS
jgi:hypothetical protein